MGMGIASTGGVAVGSGTGVGMEVGVGVTRAVETSTTSLATVGEAIGISSVWIGLASSGAGSDPQPEIKKSKPPTIQAATLNDTVHILRLWISKITLYDDCLG